ncbi:MAG TPA: SRPBCC family protein [Gaiellaceae bacterium]|nr:SRPBCC family protein [Gaiellaceae bacterium]
MTPFELNRTQTVPLPLEQAFSFFGDPSNLEAITPPWLRFAIVEAPDELRAGSRLRYRLRLFGLPLGWTTEIAVWQPPRRFVDVQLRGPYLEWVHTHRLESVSGGTEIFDSVRYRIAGGPLAPLAQRLLVRRWLDEIFDFRRGRIAELLR